jgi:hypothetical protein
LGAGFGFVIANKMEFYAVEKNVSSGMERQREDYKSKCSIHISIMVLRMAECFFSDDDGCFCVCVERSGTGSR